MIIMRSVCMCVSMMPFVRLYLGYIFRSSVDRAVGHDLLTPPSPSHSTTLAEVLFSPAMPFSGRAYLKRKKRKKIGSLAGHVEISQESSRLRRHNTS